MKIKFEYFKPSGKWYASGEADFDPNVFHKCIYPKEFGRRALELKILPGLIGGTWTGPFTVCPMRHNDGSDYTELVLPQKMGW